MELWFAESPIQSFRVLKSRNQAQQIQHTGAFSFISFFVCTESVEFNKKLCCLILWSLLPGHPSSKYLTELCDCNGNGFHPTTILLTSSETLLLIPHSQDEEGWSPFSGMIPLLWVTFWCSQHIKINTKQICLHQFHVNAGTDCVKNNPALFCKTESYYCRPRTHQSTHVQLTYRLWKLQRLFAFFHCSSWFNNVVTWQQSKPEWTNITIIKCRHPTGMTLKNPQINLYSFLS